MGGVGQSGRMVVLPSYDQMLWPVLQALVDLGGSASVSELNSAVVIRQDWKEDVQQVLHEDGPQTEIGYRLSRARSYLKGDGACREQCPRRVVGNRVGAHLSAVRCRAGPPRRQEAKTHSDARCSRFRPLGCPGSG